MKDFLQCDAYSALFHFYFNLKNSEADIERHVAARKTLIS